MKFATPLRRWAVPTLAILFLFTLIAWNNNQQTPTPRNLKEDTVPKKKSGRLPGDKDLDKELRELEKARLEVEKLKDFDWEKMSKELDESLKSIDMDKMKADIEKLTEQDMVKIEKELKEALKELDFSKIEKEMEKAMKEVKESGLTRENEIELKKEMEKLRKDLDRSKKQIEEELKSRNWEKDMEKMKEVDMKQMEKEMENARKEIERAKDDIDLEKLNMKDEMDNARIEIDKAKEELKGYQEMIYSMEKAGLLSTKGDYTIQYKDGELLINGKKQSAEVTNKYKKYFKKDTTIKKEDGDFNIDID